MASEKIEAKKDWQYFTQTTGNTAVNISSLTFKELLIQVDGNHSGNKEVFYIPKFILSSSNNWFRMGGYGNAATQSALVTIRASLSEVALVNCYMNNQDFLTGTVTQIFYR